MTGHQIPVQEGEHLYGGAKILAPGRIPLGVIGLLVRDKAGRVLAVSHVGVDSDGAGPIVEWEGVPKRLGKNVIQSWPLASLGVPGGNSESICSLIGAFIVPTDMRVSAQVASLGGLGTVLEAIPPIRAARETLRLVDADLSYSEWRITTIGVEVCFEGDGKAIKVFSDAVECSPTGKISSRNALAGAVFFTPIGHPVGVLVGWREGKAILAPLRPFLWHEDFSPLSRSDAAEHNGDIAREYLSDVSDVDPSADAVALAETLPVEQPMASNNINRATSAPPLVKERDWTYRFALFPLRPAPAVDQIPGAAELATLLGAAEATSGQRAYASRLRTWLGSALRSRSLATTDQEIERSFSPLVLEDSDRPAREVVAALGAIDPYRKQQAVSYAINRLRRAGIRYPPATRTQLWWIVHDFLVRRDEAELRFDLEDEIFRVASIQAEILCQEVARSRGDAEVSRQLFAVVEIICALPPRRRRNGLIRTITRRLAPSPNIASFCAARLILQIAREAGSEAGPAIAEQSFLLGVIRNYESDLASRSSSFSSRFDDRLHLVLLNADLSRAEVEDVFTEISRAIGREGSRDERGQADHAALVAAEQASLRAQILELVVTTK
jgi:hypothetical protein